MIDDAVETTPDSPEEVLLRSLAPARQSGPALVRGCTPIPGMEKAVERNITERINRAGMQDKFGRILVSDRGSGRDQEQPKRTAERPPCRATCWSK